jgi:hypothetical protein
MNFQQAAILLALPLASIPLIIHLINQRRFQTLKWGAMMFLVAGLGGRQPGRHNPRVA